MKRLQLAAIETHVADARTCCLNPATTTHRQMTDEQLAAAGIPAGLVRLSCGLEDKADLLADLQQALAGICGLKHAAFYSEFLKAGPVGRSSFLHSYAILFIYILRIKVYNKCNQVWQKTDILLR